jgi:dUTP pyrophosphatase
MKIKVKKLNENAVIPKYAKEGDAGLDLTAITQEFDDNGNVCYDTGLSIEIPEGFLGLIFPRSSISKYTLSLSNAVGVIDSGYRGSILLKFRIEGEKRYKVGEKVGQLIILPFPYVTLLESDQLSDTVRGVSGFGSTGR